MRNLRTLMVGGTGVLGSAIAKALVRAGHDITIVTDDRGSFPPPHGIAHHEIIDRNDPTFPSRVRLLSKLPWDLVIDVVCYQAKQAEALHRALEGQAKYLIAISSAIIYESHGTEPLDELSPLASNEDLGPYGLGKVAFEQYWMETGKDAGLPVTILRLPHILGRGCELGIIPMHNRDPYLISRIMAGKPLLLAEGGTQLFNAVAAADVAAVILRLSEHRPVSGVEVLNCANPEPFSGIEYFGEIGRILGFAVRPVAIPSAILRDGGWGWEATASSRVLSVERLEARVGAVTWSSLGSALEECVAMLLNRGVAHPGVDLLADVERDLRSRVDPSTLAAAVRRAARARPRTNVDARMNAHILAAL